MGLQYKLIKCICYENEADDWKYIDSYYAAEEAIKKRDELNKNEHLYGAFYFVEADG